MLSIRNIANLRWSCESFCMQKLQMTILYAVLHLTNYFVVLQWMLVGPIAVHNFCMHYLFHPFSTSYCNLHFWQALVHYYNQKFILHLTTFVCTFCNWWFFHWAFEIDNPWMRNSKCQLLHGSKLKVIALLTIVIYSFWIDDF